MRQNGKIAATLLVALAATAAFADYMADVKAAAQRKRDVMYYRFGFEPGYWPKSLPFSVDNFVRVPLAGITLDNLAHTEANVDTLVYVPVSGFLSISAKIPSAEAPYNQPDKTSTYLASVVNHLKDMHAAGTDPVKEAAKWAHANKKEFIVALSVNERDHGDGGNPEKAAAKGKPEAITYYNYFFPKGKYQHSDWVMGLKKPEKSAPGVKPVPPRYGSRWDADYGNAAVREKFIAHCKEIAENYDVDGLMIDFTRNPVLFSGVAWGGLASSKDMADLTAMMTTIRGHVNAAGQKKNHPIPLSIMIPDSVTFCRDIGLDLQAWSDAKLFDFIVAGGDVALNPPSAMKAAADKFGVPYYAALSISGIYVGNDSGWQGDDERPTLTRQSPETYAARAMEARVAGAKGVMMVNEPHWHSFGLRCLGKFLEDPAPADKRYHVTYRSNYTATRSVKDAVKKHCTLEQLISGSPVELKNGTVKVEINVWDDFAALKRKGIAPELTLTTEASVPSGMDIAVSFNGKPLKLKKKIAGSQQFVLPLGYVTTGKNDVFVKSTGRNKRGQQAKLGNVSVEVRYNAKDGKNGKAGK